MPNGLGVYGFRRGTPHGYPLPNLLVSELSRKAPQGVSLRQLALAHESGIQRNNKRGNGRLAGYFPVGG
jgi:hypothetical protein